MKNNRKNRNLKFIRVKNKLRLGFAKFSHEEKVSQLTDWDNDGYWEKLINTAKKSLFEKYKLSLNKIEVNTSMGLDDFIKITKTNSVILSLK